MRIHKILERCPEQHIFLQKKLSQGLKVPVGIINASQGGSPIASWMNKESLQSLNKTKNLEELQKWEHKENITKKQIFGLEQLLMLIKLMSMELKLA